MGSARRWAHSGRWLTSHTSKTAVVDLMRMEWRTVCAIAQRVVTEGQEPWDRATLQGFFDQGFSSTDNLTALCLLDPTATAHPYRAVRSLPDPRIRS